MEDSFQQLPARLLVSRRKPWLLLGGIFIIVTVLGFSLGYGWFIRRDRLPLIAPVDTIAYVQIADPVWPWQSSAKDLPLPGWYQFVNQSFSNTLSLEAIINNSAATAVMVVPMSQQEFAVVIASNQPTGVATDQLQRQAHRLTVDQTSVVTSSAAALRKIQEVQAGSIFALTTNFRPPRAANYLYLNRSELLAMVAETGLAFDILAAGLPDHLTITWRRFSDGWRFTSSGFNPLLTDTRFADITQPVPGNFSFIISGINLAALFNYWTTANSQLTSVFAQTAAGFQALYNFDLDRLTSVAQAPVTLIGLDPADTIFGFDFVILLPIMPAEQLSGLERLVSIILAQQLPVSQPRVLPDGTAVSELLVNPEAFVWRGDNGLRFISEPRLNFFLAYQRRGEQILLASSRDSLERFIAGEFMAVSLADQCGFDARRPLLIFNSRSGFTGAGISAFMPAGITLIQAKNDNSVVGCVVDN